MERGGGQMRKGKNEKCGERRERRVEVGETNVSDY